MAAADDGAIDIGSGSGSAGGVTETVGRGISSDDCVLQSHDAGAHTDAAAGTFGHEARRLVSSALVDAGVAGLRVVKADDFLFIVMLQPN